MLFAHHPDRNASDPTATARFRDIRAAYDTLRDPLKRMDYSLKRDAELLPSATGETNADQLSYNFGFSRVSTGFSHNDFWRSGTVSGTYPVFDEGYDEDKEFYSRGRDRHRWRSTS